MANKSPAVRALSSAVAVGVIATGVATAEAAAQPVDDNFAFAQSLPGPTNSVTGTNVGATAETGEPEHLAGRGPFDSVWFRWTAPASGHAVFRTQGSGFDTVLAAYTGTALGSLTQIASNDDTTFADGTDRQSLIRFPVVKGSEYHIAVDGFSPTNLGTVKLSWTSNDDFGSAQPVAGPVAGAFSTVGGNNIGATLEAGEPLHGGLASGNSVWYSWKAPATAPTEISTVANQFDTLLGVYTGSKVGALTTVAEDNDSGPTPLSSAVSFGAVAGKSYRIAVAGPITRGAGTVAAGSFVLKVAQLGPKVFVGDASVREGDSGTTTLTFPVRLTDAGAAPVTVSFATADGTAVAGSDYTAKTGTVTIPAGATSAAVSVSVIADTTPERTEQLSLILSAATGGAATISDPTGVGTIVTDDDLPALGTARGAGHA